MYERCCSNEEEVHTVLGGQRRKGKGYEAELRNQRELVDEWIKDESSDKN